MWGETEYQPQDSGCQVQPTDPCTTGADGATESLEKLWAEVEVPDHQD